MIPIIKPIKAMTLPAAITNLKLALIMSVIDFLNPSDNAATLICTGLICVPKPTEIPINPNASGDKPGINDKVGRISVKTPAANAPDGMAIIKANTQAAKMTSQLGA